MGKEDVVELLLLQSYLKRNETRAIASLAASECWSGSAVCATRVGIYAFSARAPGRAAFPICSNTDRELKTPSQFASSRRSGAPPDQRAPFRVYITFVFASARVDMSPLRLTCDYLC